MIEEIVSFAPGDPETLVIDTAMVRTLQIDGVKYSAELFRTLAAPDPQKYYRFVRDGETVTVTEFRIAEDLSDLNPPISEDWLRDSGFKWHQIERQPSKHWVLWLGDAIDERMVSFEDLGVEVAVDSRDEKPFAYVWLRADYGGRYSRFLHVRHMKTVDELIRLIEGVTGQTWDIRNNFYGSMCTPKQAERRRREQERMDLRMLQVRKWYDVEKDDTRGRALPEHLRKTEGDST